MEWRPELNIVIRMKIDETDRKIINAFSADSKVTLRKLAQKIGVSFVTVMNRVKRLEKEGVIRAYTAKIDYEKLGYDTHVIIDVRISKGKLFELEKKIAMVSNIYAVYDTTGGSDATVIGRFRSTKALDSFLKTIQTYDFVEKTTTKLVLNTIKESQVRL